MALALLISTLALPPQPYPSLTRNPGHDPSAAQRTSDGFIVTLVSGSGGGEAFGMKYLDPADYSSGWHAGESSYLNPNWLKENATDWGECARGKPGESVCAIWAPDLPSNGNGFNHKGKVASDQFDMYYSLCPPKDKQQYCVGRATGTWNPPTRHRSASITWTDDGAPIVCTSDSDVKAGAPRAIDPSVGMDKDSRLWLSYGSYSNGGVVTVELNVTTGRLADEVLKPCKEGGLFPYCWPSNKNAFVNVANHFCNTKADGCAAKYLGGGDMLEASYLFQRQETGDLFLFVNYYWCCRGMDSTYEIRVGKSPSGSAAGRFLDREGKDMAQHGGTLLLGARTETTSHTMIAPGHPGVFKDIDGMYAFSFDFMAIDSNENMYRNQLRKLSWDKDGWPVISNQSWFPAQGQ
jgi:arabinan endo-1,5-alpha-L-arabinosidase